MRWRLLGLVVTLVGAGCGDDSGSTSGPDAAAAMDAAMDASGSAPRPGSRGDAALVQRSDAGTICSSCDDNCEEAVQVGPAMHVAGGIEYQNPPPTGGLHGDCWGDYIVYAAPTLPPERWVHNLEHGAVVFLYNCPDGCDDEVAALEMLQQELDRTLVTPYADMPEGFAAVAWGHRLRASCLDVDAFRAFYDAHFDHAPESIAGGAPSGC